MTERDIQIALYYRARYKSHEYIAPNVYHFNRKWESDLISVTRAGFIHEYEIKCSASDYRADFDKAPFQYMRHKTPTTRHEWLADPKSEGRPNYFWFVMPAEMIDEEEIPDHAGLIYCTDKRYGGVRLDLIRDAPRLHNEKMPKEKYAEIGRKMMYRFWKIVAESPQLSLRIEAA